MTITIITACYNSAAVIRTAMDSVLRQTWAKLEYLMMDGGSTDGTVAIIREYEPKFNGRMRWVSERDSGMYDAINKGIRLATGDVVGLLNADDVLSSDDVVERVALAFGTEESLTEAQRAQRAQSRDGTANRTIIEVSRQGAEAQSAIEPWNKREARLNLEPRGFAAREPGQRPVDVVFGDVRFVANRVGVNLDDLRNQRTMRYYSAKYWHPWMLQWGFMPPHPSVYIRRACFERLGYYALDYQIAADYALLIRFLRKARVCSRYVPICFVDMRVGGMSTKNWRSNLLLNQEIVRGNREAGYFCCLPMLVPKYAFKVFEFVGPRMGGVKRA